MESYRKLLLQNKAWVEERLNRNPQFFKQHEESQTPEFLWIGCSDSRVPANEITHTDPGEIFVHRNIANLVVPGDRNLTSVVEYAVGALGVKHVIVCGHYGCGGIAASMQEVGGVLEGWLSGIRDVHEKHTEELDPLEGDRKLRRLVELSTIRQIENLTKMDAIQQSWREKHTPLLHAWVYDLGNGRLHQLQPPVGPGGQFLEKSNNEKNRHSGTSTSL